jgi:23S rRNA (adenine2503-C2)-methyltransferase
MPVNRRWNISEVLSACLEYYRATGRRISFEYTLIKGQNSSAQDASALAALLNSSLRRGESFPIHVNLIPVNPVKETGLMPPDAAAIKAFSAELERRGVRATVRRTLGPDINASCGQLRRAAAESK